MATSDPYTLIFGAGKPDLFKKKRPTGTVANSIKTARKPTVQENKEYQAAKWLAQQRGKTLGATKPTKSDKPSTSKPAAGASQGKNAKAIANAAAARRVAASKNKKGGTTGGAKSVTAKPVTPAKTTPSTTSTTSSSSYSATAKEAVSAELDPKIKAIQDAKRAYDTQASTAYAKTETRGKQVTHDIDYLYKQLDSTLAEKQTSSAAGFATAKTAVDKNYQDLITKLTSNTKAGVSTVNAEAERLGLVAPTDSRIQSDGDFTTQLAEVNRQNAALMLGSQAASNAETGSMIRSAEQGLATQKSADFQTANSGKLTDMFNQRLAQDTKYNTDISTLEQSRSTMEKQYLQQLEQQAYDRVQESSQQEFMNQLAVSKFSLSQDTFAANQAYRAQQLTLEQAKIKAAALKASGGDSKSYNITGAAEALKSSGANAPVLTQAFNQARQAGEFDFNDAKTRETSIGSMRAWLAANYPALNTGENMDALIRAYDIYQGVNYA